MSDKTWWLKCETSKGMFPDELAVEGKTIDGLVFSFFIHPVFVKEPKIEGENYVKVWLYADNGPTCSIKLPEYPFETSNCVNVSREQLMES